VSGSVVALPLAHGRRDRTGHNSVYAARYRHPTTRDQNKLKPTRARTVIAAALLRQLWAVVTTGKAWDPARAAHRPIDIEEAIVA